MIAKFPFNDQVLQQFAFLDPSNRDKTSLNGIVQLASGFGSFSPDEMDTLNMEFRDYRASLLNQLPTFDIKETGAIDQFQILKYIALTLAQVLLVLPYSNADPERLFSMVRKIETEE